MKLASTQELRQERPLQRRCGVKANWNQS
ncbi:unnamed protein product [Chondrus crispus]|uniref:Uncharacterized protein n=1 Tax=Chondrus crispus TaxID=2769 RepID=R7QB05_CHOCR|nr:unnamed protein product [Chondrus crispus]CDF35254.1 unnamed protein product [Chondrus crispus]|eukprot:XP_005715073.1 unnamed protein product [Chondrus crispus]